MSELRPRRGATLAGGGAEAATDPDLLRQMQLGNESAFEVLYTRYGGLIFTLALRIVGDRELAREVLQDTLLRCWDGKEAYDPSRGRVPAWLVGIARHRAIDLLRSRPHQARLREREPLTGLASETAQPDATDAVMLRRAVTNALQGLPTGQREAIELAYYAGHTQAEIARVLSEPLGTIKSRTREAMERLRTVLWPLIEPTREVQARRD